MVERMDGSEKQLTPERRKQNAELEALVHPNHVGQIDEILANLNHGKISLEEAQFAARQVLIEVASIDTKTGLRKAESLNIRLAPIMEFASRNKIPLTIVYIDGDDYKKINDQLGHDVGDVAIFALAQAIKESTRDSDLQSRLQEEGPVEGENTNNDKEHARMGGDEFVIVLPNTNTEQASEIVLPRISKRFSEITASDIPEYDDMFGHPITFSAGIAQFDPQTDTNPANYIKRAETAMRHAKQTLQSNGTVLSQYNPQSGQVEHHSV